MIKPGLLHSTFADVRRFDNSPVISRRDAGDLRSGESSPQDPSEEPLEDLVYLQNLGFAQSSARGLGSMTKIQVHVRSHAAKSLHVLVTPGTCFPARGPFQCMVVTAGHAFTLLPGHTHAFEIRAACLNATRAVPGWGASFGVARRASYDFDLHDLEPFLEGCEGAAPMVVQAGVWALVHNYSAARLALISTADARGVTRRIFSQGDIAEACNICSQAGIDHRW
jgi:hypothetical protein